MSVIRLLPLFILVFFFLERDFNFNADHSTNFHNTNVSMFVASGIPLWCSRFGTWHHCCGSGHCCGVSSIPAPGTSTFHRYSQKKKRNVLKKLIQMYKLKRLRLDNTTLKNKNNSAEQVQNWHY